MKSPLLPFLATFSNPERGGNSENLNSSPGQPSAGSHIPALGHERAREDDP